MQRMAYALHSRAQEAFGLPALLVFRNTKGTQVFFVRCFRGLRASARFDTIVKKSVQKFFTVSVFSFFLALIAGCAEISTDAYVFPSKSAEVSSALKNVTLAVSSSASLLSVSSSRTIAPSAYNASELNFFLGGKNVGTGASLAVQQVEFVPNENSSSSGTIVVPLNSYNYILVLLAIPKSTTISLTSSTYVGDIVSSAVLAGNTTADLRYNSDSSVNFYLSPEGLSGNGSYSIKFYLNDWSSASRSTGDPDNSNLSVVDNVSVGLYDIVGGSLVTGTDAESQSFASALSADTAYSYTNSAVAPGTYDLCVTFTYAGKYFIYSDKIIILPYQTTSATIGIPDILQAVPAAPTEFKQGYLLPDSDESNYYRVAFSWEDNSNTETGFELQLLDITDLSSVTTESENSETTWAAVSSTQITSWTTDFEGSSNRYALSLSRNSTGAVFYLPLGKRYLARIRSVNNDIGGSAWCYAASDDVSLTIPAGESTATNEYLTDSESVSATAFTTAIINLFRITYNVVGGTFSQTTNKTYYFEQISDGIPILTPNGVSINGSYVYTNAPVLLSNGSTSWSYWAISNLDGEKYPMSYTQCSASSAYDESITYYNRYKRTDSRLEETLSQYDINGSEYTFKAYNPQPTQSEFETSPTNYYTSDGNLANYIGCKNLSLYAVYESDASDSSTATDYSIKTNLDFAVLADLTACTISNYMFRAPASTSTFNLSYDYKTTSFTYDSVSLTLTENGGSEIGTYSPTSQIFSFSPSNLSAGIYTLTITATKSGAEFRTSLIMILE